MFKRTHLYQPPSNLKPAESVPLLDVIVTAMGDEREKYLRDMQAVGWTGEAWLYLTQHSVEIARTGKAPTRNQVAYKAGDYATLKEEWFAHNPDGSRVLKNKAQNYAMMDFRQMGWRDFFYVRTKEIIERNPDLWKVIIFDDVSDRFFVNEVGVVKSATWGDMGVPLDRSRYIYSQYSYLRHMRAVLSEFCEFGGNLQGDDLDTYTLLMDAMAGNGGVVINEHQFLDASGNWQSRKQWGLDVDKTAAGVKAGARVVNVAQLDGKKVADGDAVETAKMDFWLASHALTADDLSYIAVAPYDKAYPIPGLDKFRKLGKPLAPYHSGHEIFYRSFENGEIALDPAGHGFEIRPSVVTPPQPTPDYVTIERYNALLQKFDALLQSEIKTPGV